MILLRIDFPTGTPIPHPEVLNEMAKAISQNAGGCPVLITADRGKGGGAWCPEAPVYPVLVLYSRALKKKPEEIENMVAKSLQKGPFAPENENRRLVHFLVSARPAMEAFADLPWPGWA